MTEFTAEWIKQWRFLNTPIKDTFCISALIFSEALDEIERLQKENKELKEFVDATRPTGICEICTYNVISRYEPLQARVQELEQERRWIPVSEKPESGVPVLVWNGGVHTAFWDARKDDLPFGGNWVWYPVRNKRYSYVGGVRYWQPIPQPPQEGE